MNNELKASGLIGPNTLLIIRLEQFLSDGNVDERVAAVNALADLKSASSIPIRTAPIVSGSARQTAKGATHTSMRRSPMNIRPGDQRLEGPRHTALNPPKSPVKPSNHDFPQAQNS